MKLDYDRLQHEVLTSISKTEVEGLSQDDRMLIQLAELNMFRLKAALYGEGSTGEESLREAQHLLKMAYLTPRGIPGFAGGPHTADALVADFERQLEKLLPDAIGEQKQEQARAEGEKATSGLDKYGFGRQTRKTPDQGPSR